MTAEAHQNSSLWVWRLIGRACGYCGLGLLIGAVSGASLGCIVGGNLVPLVGSVYGGAAGAGLGGILGAIMYFIAGFFSRPDNYWTTLKRVAPFTVLGMAACAIPGSLALMLAAEYLERQQMNTRNYGATGWLAYLPDPWILVAVGGPITMLLGQLAGTLVGLKKRWGAREEQLRSNLVAAYWQGGIAGLGAGAAFGLLGHWLNSYHQVGRMDIPINTAAGAASGATAALLGALLTTSISFYTLPVNRWPTAARRSPLGCALGILLAILEFSVEFREQLAKGWPASSQSFLITIDVASFFPVRALFIGLFTGVVLWMMPFWIGEWWRGAAVRGKCGEGEPG